LAQALIHDPDILILDEPTSGLDPLQIKEIRDLIKSLAGHKTIIFSTHILQEVSPVTDRVVVINEGRIIADGRIHDLAREAMGVNRLFTRLRHDAAEVENALQEMSESQEVIRLDGGTEAATRFEVRGAFDKDLAGAVSRLARERSWELLELHESRFSLEETFIALTRQSQTGRKGVA